MTTETHVRTPRAELAAWVRQRIKDEEEVHLPTLKEEARDFFAQDEGFLRRLLDDMLDDMLYDVVQRTVASTRGHIVMGDVVTTADGVTKRGRRLLPWASWMEHTGERSVRLLDMRKADLLLAAQEREKRGTRELELAGLWRTLAKQMNAVQQVREVFSEDEIEAARTGLAKPKRGVV